MIEKTVAELSAALAAGETTSVALTQAYLDQIAAHNEVLNAYITVCADSAIAQARAADEARAAGSSAPLLGIPIAHKDLFLHCGRQDDERLENLAQFYLTL